MENITFNKDNYIQVLKYTEKPVINLTKVNFLTSNKTWLNQLVGTILKIKISGKDDNNELYSEQNTLSIGAFISKNDKQPIIKLNETYKLIGTSSYHNMSACNNWEIEISIAGLNFREQESLIVDFIDTNYIKSRVDDWEKRIKNLNKLIADWSNESSYFSVRPSRKIVMYEEMMKSFNVPDREIESIDIIKENKVIISLKPFGLWIIGANGRVDLLTAKGVFVLVDEAETFHSPIWKLYNKNDKRKSITFSIDSLLKLLEI